MTNNSICLNMIVKNEAHVIKNTLENLCNCINFSYYVISDTGSTDDTIKIIKDFFDSKNINGEILNDEWKDFGYNRTLSLKHAHKKTKYLFIFDADDKIFGKFSLPSVMDKDSYYLKFGIGVTYKRILIVNNQLEWEFVGVLHEYINCIDNKNTTIEFIEGDYYVESGKTGSRSSDPQKYQKDAIVLEKAYNEAEQNNKHIKIRYSFYCAQSYRDSNQKEKAIEWYKKRVSLKDWNQEVYFSYYMIGKLYYELNEIEKAIYYWSLSYEADRDRYEGIYEIISHFRKNGNPLLAYQYYSMITNFKPDLNDKLFVYYPIYQFLVDYELTVILSFNNKHKDAIPVYKKLFMIDNIPLEMKLNIFDTIVFYLDHITLDLEFNERFLNFVQRLYLQTNRFIEPHINSINKTVDKFVSLYDKIDLNPLKDKLKNKNSVNPTIFLSITSCKRYDLFKKTVDSLLICCKDLHLVDYFFCIDDNSSKEDRKSMLANYPFFKYYFKKEEEKGHLNSMNIIWDKLNDLKPKYWIHLEDDWLFVKPCNYVQKSMDFLKKYDGDNIHQILFNKNYGELMNCYNLVGGKRLDNDFILHIKDEPNLVGSNCAYWAHYSFRPSMTKVETILKLGNYNSANTFFERDYADKYFGAGYQSAFFNEITCKHIGKLTSEENSPDKKNAYQLNGINQGVGTQVSNIAFIILDKMTDDKYCSTQFIKKIFINNSFMKKNIYYLLSHLNTWRKLININEYNYFVVSNNELTVNDNMKLHIKNINKDIIMLKSNQYIINKAGALKLINHIDKNGIASLEKFTLENIFLSIQGLDYIKIDDYTEEANDLYGDDMIDFSGLNESDYIFIKNKDHYGNDIYFKGKENINTLLYNADINDECIGFNTLGFFKNEVNYDKLIDITNFGNDHGIYININRYIKKYGKSII